MGCLSGLQQLLRGGFGADAKAYPGEALHNHDTAEWLLSKSAKPPSTQILRVRLLLALMHFFLRALSNKGQM